MPKVILACVAVAAASLLLPSQPSYDPWAWLVWGREILHLDLNTLGGPSWKPLPVAFTTLLAPLSKLDDGIPPALWLVVARAGGLLASVFAFRLAARLVGPERWVKMLAGTLAAVALFLTPQWLRYLAHGNEVPMTVALMLWGVERHLDGHRRHALVLAFLACLLRPEVFPFLLAYAGWLFFGAKEQRRVVLGLFASLPLLWIVPEWVGSNDPWGGWTQARTEPYWSLSLRDKPWLSALSRGHRLATLQVEIGALLGIAFAVRRRDRLALGMTFVGVLWVGLVVLMTQFLQFSGNARYFVAPIVIACLLAGAGGAQIVQLVVGRARRLAPPGRARAATVAAAVLMTLVLGAGLFDYFDRRFRRIDAQYVGAATVARLHSELEDAVVAVGGPNVVTPYGAPTVNRPYHTHLAWELKIPIEYVEKGRGQGVVFYSEVRGSLPPADLRDTKRPTAPLGHAGDWRVFRSAGAVAENARGLESR